MKFIFKSLYFRSFFFIKEKKRAYLLLSVFLLFLLPGCRTTKFVPDGEALLDKVDIKVESPYIKKEELKKYLRQTPNSSVFGVWRMQLNTYSLAGRNPQKWINRVLMKAGEAPVIYSSTQKYLSEQNLEKMMHNKGFVNASVSSEVKIKNKKARVSYFVNTNEPYVLGNYSFDFSNKDLQELAGDSINSQIEKGMFFNVDVLDKERERIANSLRKRGYYKFNKDFLVYTADSTLKKRTVDLEMKLRELDEDTTDSIYGVLLTKYYIRNILFSADRTVKTDFDVAGEIDDSMFIRGGNFALKKTDKSFLKLKTLVENTFISPNKNYSDSDVERTYAALNALPPVKYVNISFKEVSNDSLDCIISLAPTEAISLTAELETTYTEGFWGVASNVGIAHRNVFRGAESFSLQGRLAYEWQKGVLAREWAMKSSLVFPNFLLPFANSEFRYKIRANTEFTANVNYQYRPGEFTVKNAGGGIKYGWKKKRFRHTFELIEVNFVDFDVDDKFRKAFLETNKFNRHTYEDLLISRIGYLGSFSTFNANRPLKNHVSMRYSFETSGNTFSLINAVFGGKKNSDGFYTIMKVPYSQYARTTYDISYHQIINKENRFVYHAGFGLGVPFGNSELLPYQRRFFSGGANSVRGWSETTLGVGAYRRNTTIKGRDYNKVGDIKLDLNFEYRYKMFDHFDGALFFDAGNVWTIKSYETQPLGEFKFDTFYKQIALAYGIGLRLDLSFVLIRLDWGIKLYDPERQGNSWVSAPTKGDYALHFGIGYPF